MSYNNAIPADKKMFNAKKLSFMHAVSIVFLWALSFGASADWHYKTESIMGTAISVELWQPDKTQADAAINAVFAEMHRLDNTLSPYIESSELYQINHRGTEANTLSITPEMYQLIERSQHYSAITDGAFDITFASLGQHYDYRNKQKPSASQTESLLTAINFHLLELHSNTQTLTLANPNTRIDLGGIAKGYAVDRAIDRLKTMGIEHASVTAGGDARVLGNKNGKPWLIGIKHPRKESGYVAIIPLENNAISTSGDYERFFIDNTGARIHHIIDPTNGLATGTASDALISVSIVGPKGFDTDPLSTSVFVLGREKGLKLIDQLPEFEAVVIDQQHRLYYSRGLSQPK